MKAVLKNGLIHPREPLPTDWADGTELRVEKDQEQNGDDLGDWMKRVTACAAEMDPEDEAILETTLQELRRQARDKARREKE